MIAKKKNAGLSRIAEKIARLIESVDTDHRGDVMLMVAERLRTKTQNFTASVLEAAAKTYGVSPE